MNFKKLMPLTLLAVVAFTTSAFGQSTSLNSITRQPVVRSTTFPYVGIPAGLQKYQPSTNYVPGGFNASGLGFMEVFPNAIHIPLCLELDPKKCSAQTLRPRKLEWQDYGKNGYDAFRDPSNFNCGLRTSTDLDTLQETTNLTNCYQNIPTQGSNVMALIDADNAACKCVRDKPNDVPGLKKILDTKLDELRVSRPRTDNEQYDPRLINLAENTKRVRAEMDRNNWGMAFQATVLSDGRADFAKEFALNSGARGTAAERGAYLQMRPSTARHDEMHASVMDTMGRSSGQAIVTTAAEVDDVAGSMKAKRRTRSERREDDLMLKNQYDRIIGEMGDPTEPNDILYKGEAKLEKPQCVGAREFMAFKQVPSNPALLQEISKLSDNSGTPDFAAWDHKKLRKEYNDFMASDYDSKVANREKIVLLKEKIKFLERNPLLKNFLGAEATGLPEYFSLQDIRDPRKSEILQSYTKDSLADRKKKLLGIMSKLAPPASCHDTKCLNEFMKSKSIDDHKTEMKAFFSKTANTNITLVENDKNNISLTADFFNKKSDILKKKVEVLTQAGLREGFKASYGLGSPDDCKDSHSDITTCAKIFSGYCQYLDVQMPRVKAQSSTDKALIDDLDQELATFFEPDIEKNKELRDFNKEICDTPRRRDLDDKSGNPITFFQYKEQACKSLPVDKCDGTDDIETLRIKYLSEYKVPGSVDPNLPTEVAERRNQDIAAFNGFISHDRVENLSKKDAERVAAGRAGGTSSSVDMSQYNREWGFEDSFEGGPSVAKGDGGTADSAVSNSTSASTKVDNKIDNSSVIDEPIMNNYSLANYAANNANNSAVANADQAQKVENMSDPQRQELLDDWQKEYDSWKKNKGNDGSAVASANEAAMKSRIEALEALLTQQKKLTEDQYRLLNEAIAKQNTVQSNAVAQNDGDNTPTSQGNGRNRSSSAITGNDDSDDTASRGPASIPDQKQTSGAGNGAGTAGVGSGSSSVRRAGGVSSGDDSVAREEAKLVNMRRTSDGSITIEATNSGSVASANAVSVPVSDEQYRALQANPQSLNLNQLEKSIPSDQIARLEKNGEITILLRNGSNPPFEVKVEKKNNKLVYSLKDKNGKDQAPVRRVFTRQALELQLKANR
jgi:hypothetical protein